ncbi:MAG: NAD(P)/FAD-dependent oxidoreductase [Vicinamibacteria bacterium]
MSPVRPQVTVVGRRVAPEHYRLRDFLTRAAQPFEWLEAGTPAADELLDRLGVGDADLPVLVDGDQVFSQATVEKIADAWQMSGTPSNDRYDLVIVGAGPAGLAAAVYAASDGLTTLVLEEDVPGGQASHTSLIENFFGFPDGIGGAELARLAGRQAERFGAELLVLRGATGSGSQAGGKLGAGGHFAVEVAGEHEVEATTLIAATGMVWRRLEVPGVEQLIGRGIYYGAGRSEAAQCASEDVILVGAGNSAGQAAVHFANATARVTMLVRGPDLAKSMSAYLVRRIDAHPLIDVRLQTEVESVEAEAEWLSAVTVRTAGQDPERLRAHAMFLCIGGVPRTRWADETGVRVDPAGYVLTGPDLLSDGRRPAAWPLDRDPLALETSIPGLFAAGDVRRGSPKRVAGAVGDGAMAVALAHRRLDELLEAGQR